MSLVSDTLKFQMAIFMNTLLFFVEKNVRILCTAKDSHILSTKNKSVFAIEVDIKLTNRGFNDKALNNWAPFLSRQLPVSWIKILEHLPKLKLLTSKAFELIQKRSTAIYFLPMSSYIHVHKDYVYGPFTYISITWKFENERLHMCVAAVIFEIISYNI